MEIKRNRYLNTLISKKHVTGKPPVPTLNP